jgi:hypothetical protein
MKKSVIKLFSVFALSATIFFASCTSDDESGNSNEGTVEVDANNFQGTFTGEGTDVVLDPSKVYKLTGPVKVLDNATLTIPAGTRIEATGGTSAFIAIGQNAQIFINGSSTAPVVMTSGSNNPNPGDWGGLVICGNAPINRAGSAMSEVGDLPYGGTNAADNSGSIQYLRVEYSGANFTAEKEFNGVSFFGVGNGTQVSYVQVYHGSDDGFEWFGGTVNTSHLVSIGNQDDQFDWTEGWTGTNTNWYAKEAFGQGNRGIEADGNGTNNDLTPYSNPTITGLTLVGISESGEPQALKLREGTQGKFNNVVLANWDTGIDIQHDLTLGWIPNNLFINGVKFVNVGTNSKGKNSSGESVDVSHAFIIDETATGAGNGVDLPSWTQGWVNTLGL